MKFASSIAASLLVAATYATEYANYDEFSAPFSSLVPQEQLFKYSEDSEARNIPVEHIVPGKRGPIRQPRGRPDAAGPET